MRIRARRFSAIPIPQLLLSSACAIVLTMKWYYTDEMSSTNSGISIEGDLTNITRRQFVLE